TSTTVFFPSGVSFWDFSSPIMVPVLGFSSWAAAGNPPTTIPTTARLVPMILGNIVLPLGIAEPPTAAERHRPPTLGLPQSTRRGRPRLSRPPRPSVKKVHQTPPCG